ncbi:MAG: hypothetical protein ACOCXH_05490 [Cyclobacteriaceae bacterium]
MKIFFLTFSLIYLILILPARVDCQPQDTTLLTKAQEFTTEQYFQLIQRQAQLYSGPEYVEFETAIDGHQYLYSELWEKANIQFDHLLYKSIDARYDLYRDWLIIKHFDESGRMVSIVPDQDLIKGFSMHGEQFIRIELLDSIQNASGKTGYFHVIYNGKCTILSKKIKNLIASFSNNTSKEFSEKERFFLIKDDVLHQISGRKSLLKLFPEHKKELRRFARRNDLYFSREKENFLLQVIKEYEMLTAAQ